MKTKVHRLAALLTLALSTFTAKAHEFWLEDTPDEKLVARFAEYGGEFEKSPGNLDSLSNPIAFESGEEKSAPFESQKKADHFLLAGAVPAKAAQAETGFTVIEKANDPDRLRAPIDGKKPVRKPFFYARWQPAGAGAAKPALNLDIVPTGKPGEACVYFRGKPLAEAKVTAYLPGGGDDLELVADKDGIVHVSVEKPGLYLLVCRRHRETQSGFSDGRFYELISHNSSLAWRQP